MTLESMHFSEITPAAELNTKEALTLRKLDVHQDIGRLSLELTRVQQEYNAKILESIQLNHALAEAGVDKYALAELLFAQKPGEESSLFNGVN